MKLEDLTPDDRSRLYLAASLSTAHLAIELELIGFSD